MTGLRHIEFLGSFADGTEVPKANGSSDCDAYHSRTIGPKGRIRKTLRVTVCAEGGENLKQMSPGRDVFHET